MIPQILEFQIIHVFRNKRQDSHKEPILVHNWVHCMKLLIAHTNFADIMKETHYQPFLRTQEREKKCQLSSLPLHSEAQCLVWYWYGMEVSPLLTGLMTQSCLGVSLYRGRIHCGQHVLYHSWSRVL